jgi:hypothetical protein
VDLVLENLRRNAEMAKAIVQDVIPRLPAEANWPCHEALRTAIMTERSLWPKGTVQRLKPILKKYLK